MKGLFIMKTETAIAKLKCLLSILMFLLIFLVGPIVTFMYSVGALNIYILLIPIIAFIITRRRHEA